MNAWLQQVRAEGLRVVYVTMGRPAQSERVPSTGLATKVACKCSSNFNWRLGVLSVNPVILGHVITQGVVVFAQALFYGLKSLSPKVAVAWSLKEEQHQQLPGGASAERTVCNRRNDHFPYVELRCVLYTKAMCNSY